MKTCQKLNENIFNVVILLVQWQKLKKMLQIKKQLKKLSIPILQQYFIVQQAMKLRQSFDQSISEHIEYLKQIYYGVNHIIRQTSAYPDSQVCLKKKLINYAESIKKELAEKYNYNLSQQNEVSIGISGPPNIRECLNSLTGLSFDQKHFIQKQVILNLPHEHLSKRNFEFFSKEQNDNNEPTPQQLQLEFDRFQEEFLAQQQLNIYNYDENVHNLHNFWTYRLLNAENRNIPHNGQHFLQHQQDYRDYHEYHDINQHRYPTYGFGVNPNQQTQ